jgi:hypothetical protein
MTKYYDVHVFYSRHDGYSKPVKIETDEPMSEEQIIDEAQLCDGDDNLVNYVEEIDEETYKMLGGI